jgi:CspA family cold shock protein
VRNSLSIVHFKEIVGDGYKSLNEGDVVEFNVEKGPKGLAATNVSVVEANQSFAK